MRPERSKRTKPARNYQHSAWLKFSPGKSITGAIRIAERLGCWVLSAQQYPEAGAGPGGPGHRITLVVAADQRALNAISLERLRPRQRFQITMINGKDVRRAA